jgi:hypothetical protein
MAFSYLTFGLKKKTKHFKLLSEKGEIENIEKEEIK